MNALPRVERRSKEANLGAVVSKRFLRLLPPSIRARIHTRPVARQMEDGQLPDIFAVRFHETDVDLETGTAS